MSSYIEKFKAGLCVVEVPKECFGEFLYFAEKYFGYDFERAHGDWEWIKGREKCMGMIINGKIVTFRCFNNMYEFIACAIPGVANNLVGCKYEEFKKEIERLEKFEKDDIFDIETYSFLEQDDEHMGYWLKADIDVDWQTTIAASNYNSKAFGCMYKTREDAKLVRKWLRYVNALLYFKRKHDTEEGAAHWVVEYVQHCYDGDRLFEILFCDFERSHEVSPVYFVSREAAVKCAKYLNENFKEW